MEEYTSLSRAEIHQIACHAHDNDADPAEVRKLLEYFCGCVDSREPMPPEMLRYIRDSLRTYLNDSATNLDGAFGLKKRKRGRRKKSGKIELEMATEVLRLRLAGNSHRKALAIVATMSFKGETTISDAWKDWRHEALIALRLKRGPERNPWSKEEMRRLEEIFEKEQRFLKEQGYIASEK